MPKNRFYTHLIDLETVYIELNNLELDDHEKEHLAQLIDANLHHTVLDAIFDQLSEEDKLELIEHLNSEDHDRIWKFLHAKSDTIEDKIKNVAEELKDELHEDLKEAHKIKKGGK